MATHSRCCVPKSLAPALIGTDMVTSNPNANPNLIPMGHFGSTDDIASVAVMLAMNAEQASSSFATWLIRVLMG